jgi:hypothetical protein
MLAVMEVPGCLVALYIVSKLRRSGMDASGNMPGEAGYRTQPAAIQNNLPQSAQDDETENDLLMEERLEDEELVGAGAVAVAERVAMRHASGRSSNITRHPVRPDARHGNSLLEGPDAGDDLERQQAIELEAKLSLDMSGEEPARHGNPSGSFLTWEMLHEVLFNPGIFLLFAGITIGFISRLQGEPVTGPNDELFVKMFQGILCLFLLEMGMTASKKLKDLRNAGWQFVLFALLAPNAFATAGMCVAHMYSLFLGQPFAIGTYVLFGVLCGAASYIAVPAVQRLAIPEASPTLPLAASLGVTFSYNVTLGIPVYVLIATALTTYFPVMT